MIPAIPAALRRLVVERASGLCEYCLLHQDDSYHSHQIDHIISRKHGGLTSAENLALACFRCNSAKGSDLGSLLDNPRRFVPLFHPREQRWSDHFQLNGVLIHPLTEPGEVTVKLLELNSVRHRQARDVLAAMGRFPSLEALQTELEAPCAGQ